MGHVFFFNQAQEYKPNVKIISTGKEKNRYGMRVFSERAGAYIKAL